METQEASAKILLFPDPEHPPRSPKKEPTTCIAQAGESHKPCSWNVKGDEQEGKSYFRKRLVVTGFGFGKEGLM